jgi:alkylated DNA nucleotide flippase Atl1
MDPALQRAVDFLNQTQIRATYEAVGQYAGITTRSVGEALDHKCPWASWVVNAQTEMPTDYASTQRDPDLKLNDEIIRTGADLALKMRLSEKK